MNATPLVHVVVLVYGNCRGTLRAVESLKGMTYPNFELIIVDNQSPDDTAAILRRKHPQIALIVNEENLGFAAGNNIGIRSALDSGSDYVLCINSDVRVEPEMLQRLVAAMEPGVGAASPWIYWESDPDRLWSSGSVRRLFHPRDWVEVNRHKKGCPAPVDVDYLKGCAVLFPSEVLRRVGLFDPRYFFYYEDFDLSERIRRAGLRLITVPGARMWHKGFASTSESFRAYHSARSSVIFFREHTRGWRRFVAFAYRSLSAARKSVGFIARGELSLLRRYWLGLYDGWRESRDPRYRNSDHPPAVPRMSRVGRDSSRTTPTRGEQ